MINQWIEVVCQEAGWEKPHVNSSGRYRFRLASGINVDVSSTGPRELRIESEIVSITGSSGDHLLEKAARAVLPRVFKEGAAMGIDPDTNTLVLHQTVVLGALHHSEFSSVMENFLNDLHFYRSICPAGL